LDVRLALRAVEDVVGGVVDDRRAERGHVARAGDVDELCSGRVGLRAVDVRPRGSVQDELRLGRDRLRDVELRARARGCLRKGLLQRDAELPAGAGDQDTLSRSDRIGDLVLQRSTTRGSFQGTPCSSGSAASYSSVTW